MTRAAVRLDGMRGDIVESAYRTRRLQLALSLIYVLGCGFRSVVPVFDVPRIALIDSQIASVLVGRTVATLAELAFVAQWALTLREASRVTGSFFGRACSRVVLPMIFVAEICSWYSVVSTSNLGHVFEESLWALAATLMVASLLAAWTRWQPRHRPAVVALCAIGLTYVLYMVFVDIPLYASRWLADEAAQRPYLTFVQGMRDIAHPHLVTYAFDIWRHEFYWMAMYFSFGVWVSIALIHSPLPDRVPALLPRRRRRRSQGVARMTIRGLLVSGVVALTLAPLSSFAAQPAPKGFTEVRPMARPAAPGLGRATRPRRHALLQLRAARRLAHRRKRAVRTDAARARHEGVDDPRRQLGCADQLSARAVRLSEADGDPAAELAARSAASGAPDARVRTGVGVPGDVLRQRRAVPGRGDRAHRARATTRP